MGVQILAHQPCPDCGSSDALTIYDWGTKCFSCKKSVFDENNAGIKSLSKTDGSFRIVEGTTKTIIQRKLARQTCELYGLVEAENKYHFPYCDDAGIVTGKQS